MNEHRFNVRLPTVIFEQLKKVSADKNTSVNKYIAEVMLDHILNLDKADRIASLERKIDWVSSKTAWIIEILKQIFANNGYPYNSDVDSDKAWKTFSTRRKRNKFYD